MGSQVPICVPSDISRGRKVQLRENEETRPKSAIHRFHGLDRGRDILSHRECQRRRTTGPETETGNRVISKSVLSMTTIQLYTVYVSRRVLRR